MPHFLVMIPVSIKLISKWRHSWQQRFRPRLLISGAIRLFNWHANASQRTVGSECQMNREGERVLAGRWYGGSLLESMMERTVHKWEVEWNWKSNKRRCRNEQMTCSIPSVGSAKVFDLSRKLLHTQERAVLCGCHKYSQRTLLCKWKMTWLVIFPVIHFHRLNLRLSCRLPSLSAVTKLTLSNCHTFWFN